VDQSDWKIEWQQSAAPDGRERLGRALRLLMEAARRARPSQQSAPEDGAQSSADANEGLAQENLYP
jgi:hypothetical protein